MGLNEGRQIRHGDGVEALAAAARRALDGGEALKAQCRAAAEALTRGRAYAEVERELLALAGQGGAR